ncbi:MULTISPECIES: branched-chain amino acid aminotransferase [unclassified Mesorhizobium]|uniref:branched-chain amino acid aminotransferase n=1 Tax=unclassified Mesorhizobium TaxID=325217 RepID=UPI0006F2ED29|nr:MULTISPECIES: branched-chain amino acid aminotransferase [unclassified Mesorhizobium]KQZ15620.1 branched-chain amino acid aminotransferase [Mesorhizobium sp. Root1471]KQZ38128.1 branched-chain amino acid aminotransferase [Mesorhizobium sp. Root554]MDR7033168.1 branched-chain amino acid aminotransferase [Mesorhizobium sp. BE184]
MTDKTAIKSIPHASPTSADARAARMENPGFGKVFSDHMVTVTWTADKGWHDGELKARAPFSIDPAAAVLHYAQEIFEGMKAYRTEKGIVLFRPEENARRLAMSAERLAMPAVPEDLFLDAVEALVRADADWVPGGDGSLYLRPFMFANEAFLGVRPATQYIFSVIASPVGSYFKGGYKAVSVWVSDDYTRSAPGGTGAAKCGGNYAASLVAQAEASRHGCDQVVFLDAAEHRWVEELGGMNVCFVMDDGSLITPPLGGTILPGITRDSILTLARENGLRIEEKPYSFDEWRKDAESGKLREAFACGTAAVVAGIGTIRFNGGSFSIGNSGDGPVTARLRSELVGIQRGTAADKHGWVRPVL